MRRAMTENLQAIPLLRRGIGLLGGSFDPVHNGHLAVARGALDALKLKRVDFVLAPRPWQKAIATPVALRLAMLEAAVGKNESLGICTKELERTGATYTIDTVRELRSDYGPAMPLVLLIGADQWENFHTWRSWREIFDYVNIAVCTRAGKMKEACDEVADFAALRTVEPLDLTKSPAGGFTRFDIPAHEASSSAIRSFFVQCSRKEAFKRLQTWLPTPVARLIALYNAY